MSCVTNITKDIVMSCDHPHKGGYTGRGVLIQWLDAPTIVTDSANARKVKSISLAEGKKVVAINNVFANPLTGSGTQSNVDSGRLAFLKTIAVRIPARGADTSANLIEPLANDALGVLLILEKVDKVVDGGFEIVGLESGAKVDGTSITRTEGENGGDILMNIVATEDAFENTFVGSGNDYATALADFEELFANSKNA